jgi:hypothetical protein
MTSAAPALPQIGLSQRRFSADEYERMIAAGILAEDERVELLEGTIYPISPIGSWHAACVKRAGAVVDRAPGRSAIVGAQDPIRLSDESEPQPDIAVLRPREDFYAGALPRSEDVLLVVEVAEASLFFDRAGEAAVVCQGRHPRGLVGGPEARGDRAPHPPAARPLCGGSDLSAWRGDRFADARPVNCRRGHPRQGRTHDAPCSITPQQHFSSLNADSAQMNTSG